MRVTDSTPLPVIGSIFSIPLLLLGMTGMFGGALRELTMKPWLPWVELALATPVVLWCGWPFFASAAMTFSSVTVIGNALRLRRAGL